MAWDGGTQRVDDVDGSGARRFLSPNHLHVRRWSGYITPENSSTHTGPLPYTRSFDLFFSIKANHSPPYLTNRGPRQLPSPCRCLTAYAMYTAYLDAY